MKRSLHSLFILHGICLSFFCTNAQEVIHKDPYDIKTTGISIMPFFQALDGFGAQLGAYHYLKPKIMLGYELNYVPASFSMLGLYYLMDDKYSNLKPQKALAVHQLKCDYHLVDLEKRKTVKVLLKSSGSSRITIQTYTEVPSSVRRILAVNGGIWIQSGSEQMVPPSNRYDGPVYIKDKSTNQLIDLNANKNAPDQTILTHTRYFNLEMGIKYKFISATGVNIGKNQNRWNQKQFELYAGLLLPVSSGFDADIATDSSTFPTHSYIGGKPTIGFKLGLYGRSVMKTGLSVRTEFGAMPTTALMGVRYYISAGIGLCFNFGKVNLISE